MSSVSSSLSNYRDTDIDFHRSYPRLLFNMSYHAGLLSDDEGGDEASPPSPRRSSRRIAYGRAGLSSGRAASAAATSALRNTAARRSSPSRGRGLSSTRARGSQGRGHAASRSRGRGSASRERGRGAGPVSSSEEASPADLSSSDPAPRESLDFDVSDVDDLLPAPEEKEREEKDPADEDN